MSCQLNNSLK